MTKATDNIENLKQSITSKITEIIANSDEYIETYEKEWQLDNIEDATYLKKLMQEKIIRGVKHD